ncbi:MAG: hypothetical protein ACFE9Q_11385 [Candidatus Hodarchaeota archaeon]
MDDGNLNDDFEFTIPVDSVINLVKEEFGYFLPYLLLKKSRRIKKVKFGKTLMISIISKRLSPLKPQIIYRTLYL